MLIRDSLIKKAITNFPTWMDIRKRFKTSNGGRLLLSTAEEVENIQNEIDCFVDQCFIKDYDSKCEKIVDFVYKSSIGKNDLKEIDLVSPNLKITDNIDTFYKEDMAYYSDGYIFTKKEYDIVKIKINGYEVELKQEKMHVWNQYDEFAIFVGIRRYENESNRELYNRIIKVSNSVINSSESGIKNSIIANLVNIIPEMAEEDISIELPCPENLVEKYNKTEQFLDILMKENKDVIDYKKWDIDNWSNDFKEVGYVPNEWDSVIDDRLNGVGYGDDLKVVSVDDINNTNVNIEFYAQDEEVVNTYVKEENIPNVLSLSLTKYNDYLDKKDIQYEIIAEDAYDLNDLEELNGEITASVFVKEKGTKDRPISDIALYSQGVRIEKSGMLEKDKFYKVKFVVKDRYDTMEIVQCDISDSDTFRLIKDLKQQRGNFILDGDTLVNKKVIKSITQTQQCDETSNVQNIGNGMTIFNSSEKSDIKVNIDNCGGQELKVIYECEYSEVLDSKINLKGFYKEEKTGSYISEGLENEIEIKLRTNQFKAVLEGQCNITLISDGKVIYSGPPKYKDGKLVYESKRKDTPEDLHIIISKVGDNTVCVEKLLYKNYEMLISTSNQSLGEKSLYNDSYWLPQSVKNDILISMSTKTQFAPIIRKIFVGTELDNTDAYETDLIQGEELSKLNIITNCKVELYESASPFQNCEETADVKVTKNYNTNDVYVALVKGAYISLDLSKYIEINSVKVDIGSYEYINKKYYIKLNEGDRISNILIEGTYNKLLCTKTIHELIEKECISYSKMILDENGIWIRGDRLYLSKILNGFVIEKMNGEQSIVTLSLESFSIPTTEVINKVQIDNIDDVLSCVFVENDGTTHICNSYSSAFKTFYLYYKKINRYSAVNDYVMGTSVATDVKISNTFSIGYNPSKLMTYKINYNDDIASVLFSNGSKWTVGNKDIQIRLKDNDDFNKENKELNIEATLKASIELNDLYVADNKEVIELEKYIINPNEKYEIIYSTDYKENQKVEVFHLKNDNFNKLKYSNIIGVKAIVKDLNSKDKNNTIDSNQYTIDYEKGILKWNSIKDLQYGQKLYIIYNTKKAIAVKYKLEWLYKNITFNVDSYKKIGSIYIPNVENDSIINLQNYNEYSEKYFNESDLIYTTCDEPCFKATRKDSSIFINKAEENNKLAVKTGWYYINNKEYYLFANNDTNSVFGNDKYINMNNVNREDNAIICHKDSNNEIVNSKFSLADLANTYSVKDFDRLGSLNNKNEIKKITTCANFTKWNTFAMKMKFKNSIENKEYEFISKDKIGYAYFDITDMFDKEATISFINRDKLKVSIAEGFSMYNESEYVINKITLIDHFNGNIQNACIHKKANIRYYVFIQGSGNLKDMIIKEGIEKNDLLHNKNIDMLNLNIRESLIDNTVLNFDIINTKGHKNNGAEISGEGYIENSSNIDWNITKIKSISGEKGFSEECSMDNVDIYNITDKDVVLRTRNMRIGKVVTKPIYIGDIKTIKSIGFKINDVAIKNMVGISAKLMQSQSLNGDYIECNHKYNYDLNYNIVDNIAYKYVKLVIYIQDVQVIKNIDFYIEYKSTSTDAPNTFISPTGEYHTEIFDTMHNLNYKVKSICVDDRVGEASLYIRAARENSNLSVWSNWNEILFNDSKVNNEIVFSEYRYFQIKAVLKEKSSKIKIKNLELEVIR